MPNIKLNAPYVNFILPATSDESYSLDHPSLGEIKVVIFSCNHCPYAQAWEDRIINIQERFSKDNVSIIMISSNDASKYPEDSFEKMKERHSEKKFNFPYLYDDESLVKSKYLEDALDSIIKGNKVMIETTDAVGCTIKWK
jgi:hypothetical protein